MGHMVVLQKVPLIASSFIQGVAWYALELIWARVGISEQPHLGSCPGQAALTPEKAGVCPAGQRSPQEPFHGQVCRTILSVGTGCEYLSNCPAHLCSSIYKPLCFCLCKDSHSLPQDQPATVFRKKKKKNIYIYICMCVCIYVYFHWFQMMLYTLISSLKKKNK